MGVARAGPTRDEVLQQAADMVFHAWEMGPQNRFLPRECAARPASGQYQSSLAPGPHTGLPYAWGGFMSVHDFDLGIATGKAAGSHSWQGTAILPCVAGVDCSGFVSEAWGLSSKAGTSALASDALTVAITTSQLQPGDVLVRSGSHVVLFLGRTGEGDALFMESAGSVGARLHSGWSYLQGYLPRRYRYIDPAPVNGTLGNPWPVSLPFQDRRRPLAYGADAIGGFACKSGVASTGDYGQAMYAIDLADPGQLRVSASGYGPVALRLLSGPAGDRCLAQADGALSARVEAGAWLLSVAARPDLPVALQIEVDPTSSQDGASPSAAAAAVAGGQTTGATKPQGPTCGALPELLGLLVGLALSWWKRER